MPLFVKRRMEMVAPVSRFVFKIVAVREKDLVICDDFNSPKNSLSHTKKSCNSSSETKIFAYFWGMEKYSCKHPDERKCMKQITKPLSLAGTILITNPETDATISIARKS